MMNHSVSLVNPPANGISNITFSNTSNLLLVSSWGSSLHLYDVSKNELVGRYSHNMDTALLDCCFAETCETVGFSAAIDGTLKLHDFSKNETSFVGRHTQPISCVEHSKARGVVVTGSWDKSIKLWDCRVQSAVVATAQLPGKVYSMSLAGNRVVVGCSGRAIDIFDIRQFSAPQESRTSALKFQTRCIRVMPDESGYVVGSVEGRVAIEYFEKQNQSERYAFRLDRKKGGPNGEHDIIHPVNAISFNVKYGTFATGGADAMVNVWDGKNRKRLCQFEKYPTSVASIDFNYDASLIAVAASYTHEEGEKMDAPPPAIYIRSIEQSDICPKPKKRSKTNN